MIYHKLFQIKKFGLKQNINIVICRIFGHRINNTPSHQICQRCRLCYEECYYPLDYLEIMFKEYRK